MKRLWLPLTLLLLIAGGLFIGQVSPGDAPDDLTVGISIGNLAPDFTGTTLEGETIQLSDFRGQIVLLNDFATWCGPCLAETPHLVEVFNAEGGEVMFIGLNLQETDAIVAGYRDEFNITYPLVMDPNGELTSIYRPVGLPTSWFIDPEGVIRYVHAGPMTKPMLEEAINAVREGREPDVFSVLN